MATETSPLVTVVIPTFNRRDFLLEAVKSVLDQTFADFELIIVDDGSDDGTLEALGEFLSDPRAFYLRQENRGVSAARNLGAAKGRGRWLAFLDSDDLWEEEKLSRQLSHLAGNPSLKAAYTEETWYRRGKWANPCNHHAKHSGEIFLACLPLCIISPSSVIIDRETFFALGGFDESLPACEDYDLWLALSARHPVGLLEERLIIKRNGHEGQLSQAHWGLDRFRLKALWKTALDPQLQTWQRGEALSWIIKKATVVAEGAKKRGADERAGIFLHSVGEASRLLEELQANRAL